MSITTGSLFRKNIDTLADGSVYRKPTIDEISELMADGNFKGSLYDSTESVAIIDSVGHYINSVSTAGTLFDLNPSGAEGALDGTMIFGGGGRIYLADQTLDFINASGTEIIGRGIRVYESDSKYAKLAYESGAAVLEVVGGTITGGVIQTDTGTGQRIVLDGSANTQTFYNSSDQEVITFKGSAGTASEAGIEVSEHGVIAAQKDSNNYFRMYYNRLRFDSNEDITDTNATVFGHNKYNSGTVYGIAGSAGYAGSDATKSIGIFGLGQGGITSVGLYAYAIDGTTSNGAEIYGGTTDLILGLVSSDNTKLNTDSNGYLNIIPSGDKLLLWEHSEGSGDVTHLWTDTSGYLNIRSLGSDVAEKGYLRLWDRAGAAGDYADMWADLDGYLNIKPAGDKLVLWESGGAANDSTEMWTDTSGYFNVKPDGDRLLLLESAGADQTDLWTDTAGYFNIRPDGNALRLWESEEVGTDYGDFWVDTNAILNIKGGVGGWVKIDDNLDVTGSYKMDGSDIINTSKQQTGDFKTRAYIPFGLNTAISADSFGTTTADATTVNGVTNSYGCRILRAGIVTGISAQFNVTAGNSGDSIRFYAQKNASNQSMYAIYNISGIITNAGCTTISNPFSVAAGDKVNVEITIYAGDLPTVTVDDIAILLEVLV